MSAFSREKMRPENRYGQMTYEERLAFATSDEGKNYLFPWGFTVDGKRYEKMVPGRVARVFNEESRLTEQSYSREETSQIFRTAFLLFAGYVYAATTFAQNCGGGGSVPDQNWIPPRLLQKLKQSSREASEGRFRRKSTSITLT